MGTAYKTRNDGQHNVFMVDVMAKYLPFRTHQIIGKYVSTRWDVEPEASSGTRLKWNKLFGERFNTIEQQNGRKPFAAGKISVRARITILEQNSEWRRSVREILNVYILLYFISFDNTVGF